MNSLRSFPRQASLRLVLVLALVAAPALAAKLGQADAGQYLEHVKFLASPELQGRGAGSAGLDRAAEYIAGQFQAAGLEPGGEDGSFFQPFTVTTGARMGTENRFVVETQGTEVKLAPGEDYIPLNFSSDAAVSGEVVFAGYGISANEFDYEDYTHFDVKDKIVVVLRYEPEGFGKEQGFGKKKRHTYHAHLITKAINARDRGAKAVLLVNGQLDAGEKDELLKFGGVAGPEDAGIVMVQVKNSPAEAWFRAAEKSLETVQAGIDRQHAPASFAFPEGLRITLEVDIEREQATVRNLLGYLPGATDEYLVIGAHYDHLGLGDQSSLAPSRIGEAHLGADDNASGTAGVIELAKMFAPRRDEIPRGILFMAFAGEEIGLLGSSHWVEHPTLPIENAVAMLNMDMIGRVNGSKVFIGGVGTGSNFKELLERTTKDSGLKIDYSVSGYSASDHTSFIRKQIPVLFFFSGLHGDYHKPTDTWDKINAKSAVRLLDVVADTAGEIAGSQALPEFVKVEAPQHGGAGSGGGGGYGPYFGSVPDFGQIETGVKFADIQPESPAAKAGLRAGDILIRFGDKPIKNLYDFTYALRASVAGDVVEVVVLREGNEISAAVKLEQRR